MRGEKGKKETERRFTGEKIISIECERDACLWGGRRHFYGLGPAAGVCVCVVQLESHLEEENLLLLLL